MRNDIISILLDDIVKEYFIEIMMDNENRDSSEETQRKYFVLGIIQIFM
jgi:hypothetical protein